MYICIYIYTHIYIYMYVYLFFYTYIYMYEKNREALIPQSSKTKPFQGLGCRVKPDTSKPLVDIP